MRGSTIGGVGVYGQYCPVAKSMELLDQRWTLLIVRELLCGSRHFNDLRRGVPRMSPALLSQRLKTLTRANVIERRHEGNRIEYVLTPSGEELRPIVEALGVWGTRWIGELGDEDFDPHLLLWDMRRRIDLGAVPQRRLVIDIRFGDLSGSDSEWWLVVQPEGAEVCDFDPGFGVDLTIDADLSALVRVWRGDMSWGAALEDGRVKVGGPPHLTRELPAWLQLSMFAGVKRVVAG